MAFVLDASITLAWCFSEEATPDIIALLERLGGDYVCVPELWRLEVGNILLAAKRKKRISYANLIEFLALLDELDIQVDHETANRGFHDILSLAHTENLTTYDAAYLELALRLGLPLATKDIPLRKAAQRLGIKTLPI